MMEYWYRVLINTECLFMLHGAYNQLHLLNEDFIAQYSKAYQHFYMVKAGTLPFVCAKYKRDGLCEEHEMVPEYK